MPDKSKKWIAACFTCTWYADSPSERSILSYAENHVRLYPEHRVCAEQGRGVVFRPERAAPG